MGAPQRIALALQGGGAHGALCWGMLNVVLDHVADGSVELVGVSGTSSGALNAAALVYGLREGAALPGPATARPKRMAEAARAKLEDLWAALARAAFWGGNPFVAAIGMAAGWNIDESPAARWADVAQGGSGGQSVPGLGGYIGAVVREVMPHLPAFLAPPVPGVPVAMISATDVYEGRRQLFVDGAISPDALKASVASPTAMKPVAIADHPYWDGGYTGNPPLTPLVELMRESDCGDLVLVSTDPLRRADTPKTLRQILDRLNEITFNASLFHEVNGIETVNRLIDDGKIAADCGYRRINLHRLQADEAMTKVGIYSKDAPAWDFLVHLRDQGIVTASREWSDIVPRLGKGSSWDTQGVRDRILARR